MNKLPTIQLFVHIYSIMFIDILIRLCLLAIDEEMDILQSHRRKFVKWGYHYWISASTMHYKQNDIDSVANWAHLT